MDVYAFVFAVTFQIFNCCSKLIFVDLQCKKIEIVKVLKKEYTLTINYV